MKSLAIASTSRASIVYGFVCLLFLLLAYRLFQLQILSEEKFYQQSEQNRIRRLVVTPGRGLVYDRFGRLIVDNRPSFSVSVIPYEVKGADQVAAFLETQLGREKGTLAQAIAGAGSGFNPVRLVRQIGFSDLMVLEEHKLDLPGVIYQIEPRRYYEDSLRAAHILGHIGEITDRELDIYDDEVYQPGDLLGKQGLERQYEEYLRGEKGYRYIQVDAMGREIEEASLASQNIDPVAGDNLHLAIDKELQQRVEQLLDGKAGAAVFLDPRNGEIRVMVSKPDYDPNFFSRPFTSREWTAMVNDPDRVLLNRATMGEYPPGSTYKLVAALAGLAGNVITPKWTRSCGGGFRFGRRVYHCFRGTVHGSLNLRQAIERSCNVYFYQLGLEIGLDIWSRFANRLQFGQRTGIDLPEERKGIAPTGAYMDRLFGKGRWTRGHMLNMVIGQGMVLVTPVQMARFAMILANGGHYYDPHLVRAVEDPKTGDRIVFDHPRKTIDDIPAEAFTVVREGMFRVVQGSSGTARGSRIAGVQFAGKTGTAENPHGNDHGWFIGFAPYDDPELAFAVIVEHGGTGGRASAPIARDIIQMAIPRETMIAHNRPVDE